MNFLKWELFSGSLGGFPQVTEEEYDWDRPTKMAEIDTAKQRVR